MGLCMGLASVTSVPPNFWGGKQGILRPDLEMRKGHVCLPALLPTALLSQTLVALPSTFLLLPLLLLL